MLTKNQRLGLTVQGAVWGSFFFLVMIPYTKEWQTLVTGVLSLMAAGWAAYLLNKQIRQTDAHELDRLRRKYIAARAVFPLALSDICDFCEQSAEQLKAVYAHPIGSDAPFPQVESQALPEAVLINLRNVLEATPHENVADRVSDIVAMIQVFQSRVKTYADPSRTTRIANSRDMWGTCLINSIAIHALASSLFDYPFVKAPFDKAYELRAVTFATVAERFIGFGMRDEVFGDLREAVRGVAEREITSSFMAPELTN